MDTAFVTIFTGIRGRQEHPAGQKYKTHQHRPGQQAQEVLKKKNELLLLCLVVLIYM